MDNSSNHVKVFAIYDTKMEEYQAPFYVKTPGQALRVWSDLSNDNQTNVGKHPTDYCLFQLAEFDAEKGTFRNLQAPLSYGLAIEQKRETFPFGANSPKDSSKETAEAVEQIRQ